MKRLLALVSGLVLVISLSACGEKDANVQSTQGETNSQIQQQEEIKEPEKPSENAALNDASASVPPQNTPTAQANRIGENKAKEIALKKAGISSNGVIFDRVELDRDNGVWHYEVEFKKDNVEYDADIKADDGTILKFEKEIDD